MTALATLAVVAATLAAALWADHRHTRARQRRQLAAHLEWEATMRALADAAARSHQDSHR